VLFVKRRAYQRKVAVAEFDAVVSGDIYVLAPKGDRLLPELLPFLCLSERFFQHAVGTSAGSLSPRTNWNSLANFEFDLPPLDQQRRIAEILWAVDEVVCEQEQMDFSPDEIKKFQLRRGDLLVCEGGEVGRSAIWDGQIEACCYQKALHRLRLLHGSVSTAYMLEFMILGNDQGMFSSLTGHSTIAHLPAIKLKSLSVPVAPKKQQEEFVEQIREFQRGLESVKQHNQETCDLRTALLQAIE